MTTKDTSMGLSFLLLLGALGTGLKNPRPPLPWRCANGGLGSTSPAQLPAGTRSAAVTPGLGTAWVNRIKKGK